MSMTEISKPVAGGGKKWRGKKSFPEKTRWGVHERGGFTSFGGSKIRTELRKKTPFIEKKKKKGGRRKI